MSKKGIPVGVVHGNEKTVVMVMARDESLALMPWDLATLWIEDGMLRVELYGPGGHEIAAEYAIPMDEYKENEA